jgi:hypothetical protein
MPCMVNGQIFPVKEKILHFSAIFGGEMNLTKKNKNKSMVVDENLIKTRFQ